MRVHRPRWLALTAHECCAVIAAAPLVLLVRGALGLVPSPVILRLVRRLMQPEIPESRARRVPVRTLVWAIEAVSRRVPRATCLTQAVSGHLLLRAFGYSSRLRLGVGHGVRGDFLAHAWLERQTQILIGAAGAGALVHLLDRISPSHAASEAERS
ncbi:MAG TPA: lasso peptide biosynthesis B2 protein [Gemmatimonadaceae bacterium]|nr:lasso peptide biosynthesis B2 protein [Gemmatimonadaceae bacterium]